MEMIGLQWAEMDIGGSCLRLVDSKEGKSTRLAGSPVAEYMEKHGEDAEGTYVFPGQGNHNAFGALLRHWDKILKGTELKGITPHVLRHSVARIGNDLGFAEMTIAAQVGHSDGSVMSKYIQLLDTAPIMAADTMAGYIAGLLDGRKAAGDAVRESEN